MIRRCLACIVVALSACVRAVPSTTTPAAEPSAPAAAQPPAPPAETPAGPPVARTVPVVETAFGVELADPYRWMEGEDNAEYADWLRAQNAYTRQQLAQMPGRERLFERIRELGLSGSVSRGVQLAG